MTAGRQSLTSAPCGLVLSRVFWGRILRTAPQWASGERSPGWPALVERDLLVTSAFLVTSPSGKPCFASAPDKPLHPSETRQSAAELGLS